MLCSSGHSKRPQSLTHRSLLIVLTIGFAGPSTSQAELPEFVDWRSEGAWQQDNGLRAEVSLNGWWRWQPVDHSLMDLPKGPSIAELLEETESPDTPAKEEPKKPPSAGPPTDGWLYRKAPGVGVNFRILNAAREDGVKHMGQKLRLKVQGGPCWVEREFTLPPGWSEKDVQLVFENVWGDGEVFLDGKALGHTWSMRWHHVDLPKPYKMNETYRLSVKCSGIISNVWLKAYEPTGARIQDSYLMTSVQKMAATIRASGKGNAAHAVKVIISDYKDPESLVKTAGPIEVERSADGWRVEQSFDWKDARLWCLSRPNLYRYSLELLDQDGKALDRIFPIRFGFREVWIKGGTFMLNNRRITLNMDIHTPLATSPQTSVPGGAGPLNGSDRGRPNCKGDGWAACVRLERRILGYR